MEKQWAWAMDYCKRYGIPPAQKWAWDQAKNAFKTITPDTKDGERNDITKYFIWSTTKMSEMWLL